MTMISAISNDRCDAIVDALRAEFGAILADRIIESEAREFLWDARLKERYVGQYCGIDCGFGDRPDEISRVAVLTALAGRWHAGLLLVDGQGDAVDLLWKRAFDDRDEAEMAFACAC